jgi:hypothetical protein
MHNVANGDAGGFFGPSRLFIYFNERVMLGTVAEDSGACIRDGIKSVNRDGACKETTWPYDISKFTVKPDGGCYTEAELFQAVSYQRVPILPMMFKAALAAGYPIAFGIMSPMITSRAKASPSTAWSRCLTPSASSALEARPSARRPTTMPNSRSSSATPGARCGADQRDTSTCPYAFVANARLTSDAWAISKAE